MFPISRRCRVETAAKEAVEQGGGSKPGTIGDFLEAEIGLDKQMAGAFGRRRWTNSITPLSSLSSSH